MGLRSLLGGAWPLVVILSMVAPSAFADDDGLFQRLWDDTSFTSIFRTDVAISTTSTENFYNQGNQPYTNRRVNRQAYIPPTLNPASDRWDVPVPGLADSYQRSETIPGTHDYFNDINFRSESTISTHLTRNLKFDARLRALYDPGLYDEFNSKTLVNTQAGYAAGQVEDNRPFYYRARGRDGDKSINPLEITGRNYIVDLPTFQLEYKTGQTSIRVGNQTIAWGSSIFFRTLDLPNGLDFRRHLILDRAIEEFSDKRVPALSLRVSTQLTNHILGDFYVSKFQPSILPNPNTPYNVIPSGFAKPYDNYYENGYDDEINAGFRLKADYGGWGWQAVYSHRYNPLGVIRWAESGVAASPVGPVGELVRGLYEAKPRCAEGQEFDPAVCRLYDTVEEAFSHAPVVPSSGGPSSDLGYFAAAADVRVDGLGLLNSAIADFPAVQDLYGSTAFNLQEGRNELNTFFQAGGPQGGLRGFIERDYRREDVFGGGLSYVTVSDNNILNGIIVNLEGQYTPNRTFTAPDLNKGYRKSDEVITSVVAEKWTRYSAAFPAAFLVLQYQYRSDSDLIGLSLDGYGGNSRVDGNVATPGGIKNANYLVFAGFQPTPNRRFVFEWAFLYDIKGGLLAQPEVQINLGHGSVVEIFYNYVNGHLYGNQTENLIRRIDYADELSIRYTYAFH